MSANRRKSKVRSAWAALRAQLERAAAETAESAQLSPARARAVLDERARVLARVPPRTPDAAEVLEVATFDLGLERYAIETSYVRRVARVQDPTPVPGTPEILTGVVNLDGEILAVFDLRVLFGHARSAPPAQPRVLVLGDGRDEFGLWADVMHEVVTLRVEDVLPPPFAADGSLVRGVTAEALIVLDGTSLLGDERFLINQQDDSGI